MGRHRKRVIAPLVTKPCLKCRAPFATTRPRENRICPPCTEENRYLCDSGHVDMMGCETALDTLIRAMR